LFSCIEPIKLSILLTLLNIPLSFSKTIHFKSRDFVQRFNGFILTQLKPNLT
jgi:hypothetical protein